MKHAQQQPSEDSARILRFERRVRAWPGASVPLHPRPRPVEDLGRYERRDAEPRDSEPDDYRHRQLTNGAAFLVCVLLIGMGVWLAIKIAELRRDQDCVLSGRPNCAQISIDHAAR